MDSQVDYQYHTIASAFYTQESISDPQTDAKLEKDIKYEFKSRLRRPLLLTVCQQRISGGVGAIREFLSRTNR